MPMRSGPDSWPCAQGSSWGNASSRGPVLYLGMGQEGLRGRRHTRHIGYSTTGASPVVPSHRRCKSSSRRSCAMRRCPRWTTRAWARAPGSLNSAGSLSLATHPPTAPGDLVSWYRCQCHVCLLERTPGEGRLGLGEVIVELGMSSGWEGDWQPE